MSAAAAEYKRAAAEAAVAAEVRSGMVVGLGTGSTALPAVEALARRLQAGTLRDVVGVPTSERTADAARALGVPLTSLAERPAIDLAIDGADEIAPGLALVKGLGGALLREKVVATAAARFVVVADESKRVARLGEHVPVPVEVLAFALGPVRARLVALGAEPVLRTGPDGEPFTTDEGNRILDCRVAALDDPAALATALDGVPGVAGHGLFLGIAAVAYVAGATGVVILTPAEGETGEGGGH